ncbi:DUF5666 domain-containing protein [Telmatobacter sp. DSM 110680]|uniref:DUF5666 domain-containing protein n=1 Tax=Telmatobacter sp. DSM 110680 TaxID=3036704 RepID=A0AAU7DLX4_9BACT
MKGSYVSLALLLSFGVSSFVAVAQDTGAPQNPSQANPAKSAQGRSPGQRGNRGGWGGGIMGRGVLGTVTEITPEHFTVKTENGELYTIHYSVNTRIMKGNGGGFRRGQGGNNDGEFQPPPTPTPIKAGDIKVGDAIGATGEMDANTKSVGAIAIVQIDPERAKEMREMQANYGKTWLMGKVTSINEVKVTLQGGPDNATHTFVADENTTFRKRRDPITLGDIQIGDMIRTEGSVKNGAFLATSVAVMVPPRQRDDDSAPPQ